MADNYALASINPSFGGMYINPNYLVAENATKAINYLNGESISDPSFTSEILGGGAAMAAFTVAPKLIHPVQSYKALKATNSIFNALQNEAGFKNLTALEKNEAVAKFFDAERKAYKVGKVSTALRSAEETKVITNALAKAKTGYEAALKAGDAKAVSKYAAEMETIISQGKKQGIFKRAFDYAMNLGKTKTPQAYTSKHVLDAANSSGLKAAEAKAAEKAAAKTGSTLLEKGGKILKTGGFKGMFIIEGLIEGATEVLPTFSQLGAAKGFKQLAKSTVNVAASAGGWAAGAAAGAAIGSIIPGAGTVVGGAIGAAIGLAGGLIGSWLGRKAATAVTGKSEMEKEKEKQAKIQGVQISQSPQDAAQLSAAVKQQAMQDDSKDAKIALEAAKILEHTAAMQTQQAPIQQTQTNPFNYARPAFSGNIAQNMSNPFGEQTPYTTGFNSYSLCNLPEVNNLFAKNYDSLNSYAF